MFPQEKTRKQERFNKRKAVTLNDSKGNDLDQGQKGIKFYEYHGMCGHTTDQCITLKALVKQAKQKRSKLFDRKKRSTNHEVNPIFQKKVKKALKQKIRKCTVIGRCKS